MIFTVLNDPLKRLTQTGKNLQPTRITIMTVSTSKYMEMMVPMVQVNISRESAGNKRHDSNKRGSGVSGAVHSDK